MPTVKVRNLKNEEIREVELSDAVFGAPLNEGLIHAAVRNFMANLTLCACTPPPGMGVWTGQELGTYVTTRPPKTTTNDCLPGM